MQSKLNTARHLNVTSGAAAQGENLSSSWWLCLAERQELSLHSWLPPMSRCEGGVLQVQSMGLELPAPVGSVPTHGEGLELGDL